MLIDCDGCAVRGLACEECVVTILLDTPPAIHQLGEAEAHAIEMFARAGFEVDVLEPTHEVRKAAASRRARRWSAA
jgi:hypothetical protein